MHLLRVHSNHANLATYREDLMAESQNNVEIRVLTEADAEAYHALRLRMLREEPEAFGTAYEEAIGRPFSMTIERLQANPQERFTLGAFAAGRLVGSISFTREAGHKTRHKGAITAMYVAPEVRAQGIGRTLVAAAVGRAQELPELEQIYLAVGLNNVPARNLYRAMGFIAYGVESHALKLGDNYLDEELMALRLV